MARKTWIDELFGFTQGGSNKTKSKQKGSTHSTWYKKDGSGNRLSWDNDKRGNYEKGTLHASDKKGKKSKNF